MANLDTFNIHDFSVEYTDRECFALIRHFVRSEEYVTSQKTLFISDIIQHITNDTLLNSTIELLKIGTWFESEASIQSLLNFIKENYSANDRTRLTAITYSALLTYEVYMKYWAELSNSDKPKLIINIKDRNIEHNVSTIGKDIRISGTQNFIGRIISPLSPSEQKAEYCKLINAMADMDFDHQTRNFKRDIKYLTRRKENIVDQELNEKPSNPHNRIFSSDFAYIFFQRLKDTVKNPLADYSFIYCKMLEDGLIFNRVGDSEFREWLSSNYEVEIDKTKQLYLCTTDLKEQLYSTIKEGI